MTAVIVLAAGSKGLRVSRLMSRFKEAGVNLRAFSGFPQGRRAQIDFTPADPAAFGTAARKAKLKLLGSKTGFLIQGEERIGLVAEVMSVCGAYAGRNPGSCHVPDLPAPPHLLTGIPS